MNISELIEAAHEHAVAKGFWEGGEREKLSIHALIIREISEATEAVCHGLPDCAIDVETGKPEGELVELADAVIRIADYCGRMDWDLEDAIKAKMEYNATRGYKHGKING